MTLPVIPKAAPIARDIGRVASDTARQPWIERLSRMGLVVRGVIYFVPGLYALEWALGRNHRSMTPASVIGMIGQQPLGRVLLVVVAIGLAGYALWGVVRAVFDPWGRGHSPAGIAQRIGFVTSAVAYAGLLVATVRLLTGAGAGADLNANWSVAVMARPFGGVLVAAIGVCWIFGSGISQVLSGWSGRFARDLALERFGRAERRGAILLGRVGLVSRGIVFTLIGVLLVAAALHWGPSSAAGLDGAFVEISHQPFGRVLLGAAGFGLMAFGAYSAMCARWMRMQRTPGSSSTARAPLRTT
jgi:hypothetical protein